MRLNIVIFGLSITSSWGNGHATTYRGLVRELTQRGHRVLFLERDVEWYAAHRDMPMPPYCETALYASVTELHRCFRRHVREADLVIVGSYVPDGVAVGGWVTQLTDGISAFYDIDTPVTLGKLHRGDEEYISRELIPRYQLYLSFTGGPVLRRLEKAYGSPMARPLYCSVDTAQYHPAPLKLKWDIGYMGTYSADRQPKLRRLLLGPARRLSDRRFVVAGPLYPHGTAWPKNVRHIAHLPPDEHVAFYNAQEFTLNITRAEMVAAGYSPSVRLFEAGACGTPIISDDWNGLPNFFEPDREILIARTSADVLRLLEETTAAQRQAIATRARARVLQEHTPRHRAMQLESYVAEIRAGVLAA